MIPSWLPPVMWWTVSHVVKDQCHTSSVRGDAWVGELLKGNTRRFRNQLRMQPETFLTLLSMLAEKESLQPSRYVSTKEKLATFLYVVGHGALNRQAQERFQRSGWTITQSIHEVLDSVLTLYPSVVVPPPNDIPWEIHSNPKMYPFLKDCVGAIDGTHIPAVPPKNQAKPFRNRKGFMSQNVLTACSFDLRFQYVLAGWEGSASDGRVFEDAILRKGFVIPPGRFT
ncbi:hypothetical protein Ae201684P_018538 [Aphanomyces euteiches]|nr:hypothetical protein Ae201684P_018538 [Aphanomyces euteiches]KAH9137191.1 hypothetical protein AeRB84_017953 [Aphanomyces euteiches]